MLTRWNLRFRGGPWALQAHKLDGQVPLEIESEGGRYLVVWYLHGGIWAPTACYDWEEGKASEPKAELGPVVILEADDWTARLFEGSTREFLRGETVKLAGILDWEGHQWLLLMTPSEETATWVAFDVRNVTGPSRPGRRGRAAVRFVQMGSGPEGG